MAHCIGININICFTGKGLFGIHTEPFISMYYVCIIWCNLCYYHTHTHRIGPRWYWESKSDRRKYCNINHMLKSVGRRRQQRISYKVNNQRWTKKKKKKGISRDWGARRKLCKCFRMDLIKCPTNKIEWMVAFISNGFIFSNCARLLSMFQIIGIYVS